MSLSCRRVRELLPAYAAEDLASTDRRDLRAHLADCRECREEASRRDVGLFFSIAVREDVSPEDVARIVSGVRAGISWRQAERRLDDRGVLPGRNRWGRRRGFFVAAVAAFVVFTLLFPGAPVRRGESPEASRIAQPTNPARGPLVPAARPGTVPSQEIPGSKFPADATIYDWSSGAGEPRVVWIVDRSLDI
jgi:Putative zinc-finger